MLNPDGSPAVHLRIQSSTIFKGSRHGDRVTTNSWATSYTGADGRFQLVVPKRGESTIFLTPPKALRSMKAIGQARGDIGDIRLEAGLMIRGRVLDEAGKPLAYLSVSVHPTRAGDGDWRAITDGQGRFELPPQLPGEYLVHVVPDLEIDGQTRAEQIPESYRKSIPAEDELHVEQPLTATFPPYKITLRGSTGAGDRTESRPACHADGPLCRPPGEAGVALASRVRRGLVRRRVLGRDVSDDSRQARHDHGHRAAGSEKRSHPEC